MPRQRKPDNEEEGQIASPAEEQLERQTIEERRDVDEFIDLMFSNDMKLGTIEIERRVKGSSRWEFVDRINVADYDKATIKQVFGPGDYKLKLKKVDGCYYRTVTFSIGETRAEMGLTPPSDSNAIVTRLLSLIDSRLPERGNGSDTLAAILPIMMEQQRQQNMIVMKMIESIGRRSNDESPLMQTLLLKLLDRNSPSGSIADMVDAVRQIKNLSAEESGESDMITKLIPLLGGVAKSLFISPSAIPVQSSLPAPAAPAGAASGSAQDGNQTEAAQASLARLQMFIGLLCKAAANGSDPEMYVDFVEDTSPEELPNIKAFLQRPDWFSICVQLQPKAAQFQQWFETLRELFFAEVQNEPEPIPPTSFNPEEKPNA